MADDLPRRLRDALRRLIVAHGVLDDARRPCGTPLPLPYAYALLELGRRPEGMTVTELASTLSIDRTNVSRLCARMAEAGEVERLDHPSDGRARLVRLTRAGADLARHVDARSAAHFARLLDRLDGDPEAILHALGRLHRTMVAPGAEPKVPE